MRFTVVGAGAIGGTLGAYLVREGEDVEVVDREREHVAAMKERGLTIEGIDETFTVPVRALHPEELRGPLDVVLLAVKAQHTGDAVRSILPCLGPASAIVSFQNGLCEPIVAALAGWERTVGCFVNFSADYLEPGRIRYGGAGTVRVGEWKGAVSPRVTEIVGRLRHWGPVRATDNVQGYLWAKLGYASMLFATALVDEPMADVIDRHRELMVELACEVYEAADRHGVRPEPFDGVEPSRYYPRGGHTWEEVDRSLDALVAYQRTLTKVKSGIWRDLAVRRRNTEVDVQIARAAEIGASHGLPMPLNRALVAMIHDLEDGRRSMSWDNLQRLEEVRAEKPAG